MLRVPSGTLPPSDNGTACKGHAVWRLTLITVITCLVAVLLVAVTIVVAVTNGVVRKQRSEQQCDDDKSLRDTAT